MDNINHKKWAEKILLFLVSHIKEFEGGNKYITYGELAKSIGYPEPHKGSNFGRKIGITLGIMGHMFDGMAVDGMKIPYIQALVVNQGEKLPSDGLKEFVSTYPRLSKSKKKDFVSAEFKRIFEFGDRWEKLISLLGLDAGNISRIQKTANKYKLYNPYGSEGSPEHINLRDYIAKNPSSIGIETVSSGVVEYPLKSGDKIDVVFITENEIIGVEVKSRRSGTDDIERGLYQCIKYCAVLEAEKKVNKSNLTISCILVLEGKLTTKLLRIQKKLGIKVFQNIYPKDEEII